MTIDAQASEDLYKSEISKSRKGVIEIEIETPRLIIRSYQDEDLNDCVDLYGNTKITKFFDNGKPRSKEEVLNLIEEKAGYFKKGQPFGLFSIFLKDKKTFIGQVDLIPTVKPGVVEIGFIFLHKYQRKGYGSECTKAFLSNYIQELNAMGYTCEGSAIKEVMATVHPANLPSKKLIEKMGMHFKKFQNRFGAPRLWYNYKIPISLPLSFNHMLKRSNEKAYVGR